MCIFSDISSPNRNIVFFSGWSFEVIASDERICKSMLVCCGTIFWPLISIEVTDLVVRRDKIRSDLSQYSSVGRAVDL